MDEVEDPGAHIRKRPGMYIGGTGTDGLKHMILEVVSNSFDQALLGEAGEIAVTIEADGTVVIRDDGPGISTGVEADGRTFLERVLTERHETPTADGHQPHVHMGFGGLGLFTICALSEFLEVTTSDGTITHHQMFRRGRSAGPLVVLEPEHGAHERGTTVRFRPDPEVFGELRYSIGPIESELRTFMHLIPGVEVVFSATQRWGPTRDLRDLHADTWGSRLSHLPVLLEHEGPEGHVSLAVSVSTGEWRHSPQVRSFCNHYETGGGGSHVAGLAAGLDRIFGAAGSSVLDRIYAVLHVIVGDPRFAGPTRSKLDSPEAIALVSDAIAVELPPLLEAHPDLNDAVNEAIARADQREAR